MDPILESSVVGYDQKQGEQKQRCPLIYKLTNITGIVNPMMTHNSYIKSLFDYFVQVLVKKEDIRRSQ